MSQPSVRKPTKKAFHFRRMPTAMQTPMRSRRMRRARLQHEMPSRPRRRPVERPPESPDTVSHLQ